jgi:hypothetical protein
MKISLQPGDVLEIGFHEPTPDKPTGFYELDGALTVFFEKDVRIAVTADLPDGSGREGVIYEERFAQSDLDAGIEKAKAEIARVMAEQPPPPKFDIEQYRMTPERKAFGDKRVAENVRFHFADRLEDYTDTQVADAYERARDDEQFDANFGDNETKVGFRRLLGDLYDTSEPGEHQEVMDAIEAHNSGEEN